MMTKDIDFERDEDISSYPFYSRLRCWRYVRSFISSKLEYSCSEQVRSRCLISERSEFPEILLIDVGF